MFVSEKDKNSPLAEMNKTLIPFPGGTNVTGNVNNITLLSLQSEPGWELTLHIAFYICQAIGIAFLMTVAVSGNFIVCMVIKKTRSGDTSTGIFVLSLAIADLLRGLTVMPFVMISSIQLGEDYLSVTACHVSGFTNSFCLSASVMTLAVVSIDRYIAIVWPLRYLQTMTAKVALMMLGVVWCVAGIDAVAPLIGWSKYTYVLPKSICTTDWNTNTSFSFTSFIVTKTIPLLTLTCCYFKIFLVARMQQRKVTVCPAAKWMENACQRKKSHYHTIKLNANHMVPKREKKSALTALIINGIFIVCITPMEIITTWAGISHNYSKEATYFIAFSHMISFANSAVNPFIYGILNRRFRRTFLDLLSCTGGCDLLKKSRSFSNDIPTNHKNDVVLHPKVKVKKQRSFSVGSISAEYKIPSTFIASSTTSMTNLTPSPIAASNSPRSSGRQSDLKNYFDQYLNLRSPSPKTLNTITVQPCPEEAAEISECGNTEIEIT